MINKRELAFLFEFHVQFMSVVRFSSKGSTRLLPRRYRDIVDAQPPGVPLLPRWLT